MITVIIINNNNNNKKNNNNFSNSNIIFINNNRIITIVSIALQLHYLLNHCQKTDSHQRLWKSCQGLT